ncbi:MAG: hypothetical protein JW736_04565 [Deltaproteobacteria bacterium]|nr:hypothetical protein [Deltaproteobacteria bacterium]
MKIDARKIFWGALLIILSAIFYTVHFVIFRDPHHLFIFLVGDIAFVFIEVWLVTMIIHELLNYREKKNKLNKLNMIIGAFFSEVGNHLLKLFSEFDHNAEKMRENFISCHGWTGEQFIASARKCSEYEYDIDTRKGSLEALREFLVSKRFFLLNLLQNSNLLEHDTFSDLLWSVFHLTEELEERTDIKKISEADSRHLSQDIRRAYTHLISEWLNYMNHLREGYPYLFSLAVRKNPFDPAARAEIADE